MYMYLWEYRVEPEHAAGFLEAYASDGTWVELFRRADGYVGTDLYHDLDEPGRYVTIDRWLSQEAHDRFRENFAAEFEQLDAACEKLTARETPLGRFSTAEP